MEERSQKSEFRSQNLRRPNKRPIAAVKEGIARERKIAREFVFLEPAEAGKSEREHIRERRGELEVKAFGTAGIVSVTRKISRHGIRLPIAHSSFFSPVFLSHLSKTVEVRYDPTDFSRCWVIIDDKIVEAAVRPLLRLSRRAGQRDVITQRQWVELSRRLLEKSRGGFTREELIAVQGFINYVAPDVETIQQPKGHS